jgi:hypothetical protein
VTAAAEVPGGEEAPGEEEVTVAAPVTLTKDMDGLVSLTFGPMTVEDLALTIQQLGTPEGNESFVRALTDGLKVSNAEARAKGDLS